MILKQMSIVNLDLNKHFDSGTFMNVYTRFLDACYFVVCLQSFHVGLNTSTCIEILRQSIPTNQSPTVPVFYDAAKQIMCAYKIMYLTKPMR